MAQGGTLKGLLRRSPERGFEGMPVLAEVHARAGTEGGAGPACHQYAYTTALHYYMCTHTEAMAGPKLTPACWDGRVLPGALWHS